MQTAIHEQFLRRAEVERITGLSRSAIYAAMRAGTFPEVIKISRYAVAWRVTEIEAWMRARITASRPGQAA